MAPGGSDVPGGDWSTQQGGPGPERGANAPGVTPRRGPRPAPARRSGPGGVAPPRCQGVAARIRRIESTSAEVATRTRPSGR